MRPKTRLIIVALAFVTMLGVALALYFLGGRSMPGDPDRVVRVLAYASFVNEWGPGPEIARRFEEKTGVRVILQDGEDSGLLLKKLELFPADVVVGLDQLSLNSARAGREWKRIATADLRFSEPDFVPFDWGPIAIVYRKGEVENPPQSLDDLLDPRFEKSLALQDPRTSSPGLQFLFWVLEEKGQEDGFEFLKKLKPNIHSVSSSWSTAYGLFQTGQAKLAVSYLTSPVYHWVKDKDERYQSIAFTSGHPVQVEYAGVPMSCKECVFGADFARFLVEPEIQKLIMEKNFMLPVVSGVEAGTPFEKLPVVDVLLPSKGAKLLEKREYLLERWEALGL